MPTFESVGVRRLCRLPLRFAVFVRNAAIRIYRCGSAVTRSPHLETLSAPEVHATRAFFTDAWAAVRGVRSLKRTHRPRRRRVPRQDSVMAAEAFLVARLALSQGPEETPVPSLRACTSRARTMAAGPTECDGGSRKGGFRDINMQLRRVGAPTAPVRDHVEPGAGSTSNAPLRRSSTWCSPPTSPMVGGWTDCPQWRVCVGERGGDAGK